MEFQSIISMIDRADEMNAVERFRQQQASGLANAYNQPKNQGNLASQLHFS